MTKHPDSHGLRLRSRLSSLVVCAPVALLATGCGLFETAGEVTLGKGQLPRVAQRIEWPDIDQMTGSALSGAAGATKDGEPLVTGLPGSLKKGSLAHVQGILGLAGDCQRSFTKPDFGKGSAVSNLEIRLTNCAGDDRCTYLCGDFRGMRIEAGVDVQLLDEKKAKNLAAQLRQASPEAAVEAIVQLRLRFFELKLFQNDDAGNEVDVTGRLDDLEMILTETTGELPENLEGPYSPETVDDPNAPDGATDVAQVPYDGAAWVKVLEGRYVDRIEPGRPQRFEIDPTVPFSERLKDTLVAGNPASLRLVTRMSIARPDLYELRFDGAGVEVDVQPEVVLSVLQLIKNL